jgi:cell division protein FtsW
MSTNKLGIDKVFLGAVMLLTIAGFLVFSSASLGLLARDGASFQSVALKQTIGLVIGAIAFIIMSKINFKYLRKYAFYIFVLALFLNLLLFIPGLALTHGGASRWIDLKFITFQPSEFLKIAFVIYFAAWLSSVKEKVASFKLGIVPYATLLGLLSMLLLAQSDTDTLVVIAGSGLVMLFSAGARIRDLALLGLILLTLVAGVIYFRPYARQRIMTFLNPTADVQGAGYQIQQSLIAIGSGQIAGRGFGQSVQKFKYLPEPIGDSIFAVGAEEFGFIGSVSLILLFLLFIFRSIKISSRSPDMFSALTVIGIAIFVTVESFMNISSMIGILPLAGMPLLFVSHGGTALIIVLGAMGIIANISKYQKT